MDLDRIQNAEFKEAFDEFDKVYKTIRIKTFISKFYVFRTAVEQSPPRNCLV